MYHPKHLPALRGENSEPTTSASLAREEFWTHKLHDANLLPTLHAILVSDVCVCVCVCAFVVGVYVCVCARVRVCVCVCVCVLFLLFLST